MSFFDIGAKVLGQEYYNPDQMRQQMMGTGRPNDVGSILDQQQGLYGSMMQGNVPQAMRQNIMGAGQDLAAQDAMSTQRLLAQGGGAGGGGLGAALGRVSSSNRGNQAMQQLGGMGQQMMQMGQQGMGDVLQARQGMNASEIALRRANMAEQNQSRGATAGMMGNFAMGLLGGGQQGQGGTGAQQGTGQYTSGSAGFGGLLGNALGQFIPGFGALTGRKY